MPLPKGTHSLQFAHSSLVSRIDNPCAVLKCSSLCLLTLGSARCMNATEVVLQTEDTTEIMDVVEDNIYPQVADVFKEASENKTGKNNGAALAIVIIVLIVVATFIVCYVSKKSKSPKKPPTLRSV